MDKTQFNDADRVNKTNAENNSDLQEMKDATPTDQEASNSAQEANEFHEGTDARMQKVADNVAEANGAQDGTKVIRPVSVKGNPKSISVSNGLSHSRQIESIGMDGYEIVSDLDRKDVNEKAQAAQYERVSSQIDIEATKAIEDGDRAILGHPSETTVYSLENHDIERAVCNDTTKLPIDNYSQRRIGTLYKTKPTVIMTSGDFVAGVHDTKKGFAAKDENTECSHDSAFILNALDKQGNIIPNQFIVPKTGKFMILGFNPYLTKTQAAEHFTVDENHARTNGTIDAEGKKRATTVQYKYHDPSKAGLFRVIDVTAQVENINVATKEVIEQLTCEKSKMQFGYYEKLANQLIEISNSMPILNDQASQWPDLHYLKNRCTLWNGEFLKNAYATVSCKNEPSNFFRFFENIRSSEMIFGLAAMGLKNQTKSIAFFKGQTGKQESDPYFNMFSGYSGLQSGIGSKTSPDRKIKLPNMVPFLRQPSTYASFKRAGQVVYGVREFKAFINNFIKAIHEDPSMVELLKKVNVMKETVEQLEYAMSYGRVVDSEGMTSNAVVKLMDPIDLILDFDPNDLIMPINTSGVSEDRPTLTKWYPAAGYANIYTDNNISRNDPIQYYVLPAWLDCLLKSMRRREWEDYMTNDLSSVTRDYYTVEQEIKSSGQAHHINDQYLLARLIQWDENNHTYYRYGEIPTQFDPLNGSLFQALIAKAYELASNDTLNRANFMNAYLSRYLKMISDPEFKLNEIIAEHFDSDFYSKITAILDNPAYDLDIKAYKPSLLPMLYPEAREKFLNTNSNIIARTTVDRHTTKGSNGGAKYQEVEYQPDILFSNLVNFKGLTMYFAQSVAATKANALNKPWRSNAVGLIGKYLGGDELHALFDNKHNTVEGVSTLLGAYGQNSYKTVLKNSNNAPIYTIYKNEFVKLGQEIPADADDDEKLNGGLYEFILKLPRTNFDANGDFFGIKDEEPAIMLFGEDRFLVPNNDYLHPTEHVGVYADGTQPIESYAGSKFSLIPADELSTFDGDADSYAPALAIKHGTFKHESDDQANYSFRQTDIAKSVDTTNPPISNIACASTAINDLRTRVMTRPSLYGYMREAAYGATQLSADMRDRFLDQPFLIDGSNYPARNAGIEFGILPNIIGVEYLNNAWEGQSTPSSDDKCHGSFADWQYYAQQNMFIGNARGDYNDGQYDISNFYDLGNWGWKETILKAMSDSVKGNTLVQIPKYLLVYLEDERKRLLNFRHAGILTDARIQNLEAEKIYMLPDFIYASDYLSKYVFNGYTNFKIGHPTVTLDRNWDAYANDIALLYKQYVVEK